MSFDRTAGHHAAEVLLEGESGLVFVGLGHLAMVSDGAVAVGAGFKIVALNRIGVEFGTLFLRVTTGTQYFNKN